MRRVRVPLRLFLALGCGLALVTTGGAEELQGPGRTIVRSGSVGLMALNHASLAFVVGRSSFASASCVRYAS
jgi:hypothetical protein